MPTDDAAPVDLPPLNGEPLALEFLNTVFPLRGALRDGLNTPGKLAWWLRSCRPKFTTPLQDAVLDRIDPADVRCFVTLRDTARRLVEAYVNRQRPDPVDVAQLNRVASAGQQWPCLVWEAGGPPTAHELRTAPPVTAAQIEIAHAVIALLGGNTAIDPRRCTAPGCVFFFDHARFRRSWCSTGCGNRARAARHYARHHPGRDTAPCSNDPRPAPR